MNQESRPSAGLFMGTGLGGSLRFPRADAGRFPALKAVGPLVAGTGAVRRAEEAFDFGYARPVGRLATEMTVRKGSTFLDSLLRKDQGFHSGMRRVCMRRSSIPGTPASFSLAERPSFKGLRRAMVFNGRRFAVRQTTPFLIGRQTNARGEGAALLPMNESSACRPENRAAPFVDCR
ncbi:hypothetical protein [Paracoccus cavernae]|uniref:hypothetical protein n=1 Tax=Paracoccus cavernae TaxID=1571207 RepID=UPI0035F47820